MGFGLSRVQAHELAQFATDTELQNAVKQYKNFCGIRRDLRTANDICAYVINLHDLIKQDKSKLDDIADTIFLVRASAMHAILLYSRWFKSTNGKRALKPKDFFADGSSEMSVHIKLVEHRDRYIAHNELDLLGEDRVWVKTDASGRFVSSDSDFLDQMWLQDDDLNMSSFQKCVHIVHNKIDAEIIPDRQRKLDGRLESLLGLSAR